MRSKVCWLSRAIEPVLEAIPERLLLFLLLLLLRLLLRLRFRSGRGSRLGRWRRRDDEGVLDRELLARADGEIDDQWLQRPAADLDHVLARRKLDPLQRRRHSLEQAVDIDLALGVHVEGDRPGQRLGGCRRRGRRRPPGPICADPDPYADDRRSADARRPRADSPPASGGLPGRPAHLPRPVLRIAMPT